MVERIIDVELELLKEAMEYSKNNPPTPKEIEYRNEWEKRTKHVCKPCWEIKYCPYGPLVEGFPLLGPTRKEAIQHNEFIKQKLQDGEYSGWRKESFEQEVNNFDANDYPEEHSIDDIEMACTIFGHLCPVFFVTEPFTETIEERRISRSIPREVLLRVVRRDNFICQICGKPVLDSELEIDHIIPWAKGGPTEEHNLRVTCRDCNRKKSSKYQP